jgi:hypothetical protein
MQDPRVLERIINKKFAYVLESRDLQPKNNTVSERRSSTDVLIILQNHVAEAFRKKESTVMVSLDISKAKNMRWRYAIIKKMKNWKIDGRMMCFIENFMKERTLRVAVGNMFSNKAAIENRIVQGAVLSLSVTLFLIAMSEIYDGIQELVKIMRRQDDLYLPQLRED